MSRPCFQALTRPVSIAGLPMSYVVILFGITFGGFIATLSFIYFAVAGVMSYVGLRLLANYDPRIADVVFITMIRTPLPQSWFRGKGIIYRA
ncbi:MULTISPECIES: VirB3 family type IV secretion system protein [Aurantimonadaceae]|uniref:Type IV secretion system protein n=2 Tax=Jiella TaxID=1775688 RepID=A0A6N9TCY1_9HYPH|nr:MULTISPECIES: VirB3 family type IV secretion system protein [Aurantimonadaceae]MAU95534.1 type IV secretion system protein [Fulvimarina sp.]NDW06738.1 type IV secretion system protein [Jiella pacifica]WAP71510.1 VirB3 family type IV secretion system protein [Jiella pelagia]